MAGLWNIEILDKALDRVTALVRQAHPDAGAFPESRAFALRILHEPAWKLDSGFNYQALAPLGQACDSQQVLDETWLNANVDRFIAEVVVEDSAATTLDEATVTRRVADSLGLADLDHLTDAERDRLDDAYHAFWSDPSNLPARRYRIQVTDPAFLSHLVPGARWSSAAF